ncbi:NAD-P-binding protein [Gloeopeniophorella convolvens]|nr:NAD-P-binding protein [Gloeopeniophorella convolvens]
MPLLGSGVPSNLTRPLPLSIMSPKVVLVTGCSEGGIGFHLAKEFALQGCKVYATARKMERMQGLRQHDQIVLLVLDVTDDVAVRTVVSNIIEQEGKIDIVVNNAGVGSCGPVLETPLEHVQMAFNVNVHGVLRVSQAAFPHMAARKQGMFITIGSVAGNNTMPWGGIYSSTKTAVHAITNVLDMECRPFNIKVLLVAPGVVQSNLPINQSYRPPPDTLYAKYTNSILARLSMGKSMKQMPTDVFAKQVVTKALAPDPPKYMSMGAGATFVWLLTWLPRKWLLPFLWTRVVNSIRTGN